MVVRPTGERQSQPRQETIAGKRPRSEQDTPAGTPAEKALDLLSRYGLARGLEVRLEAPAGVGTILRFLDPRTHEVVRQFPAAQIERQWKAPRPAGLADHGARRGGG
jgi:hypothetical protein